MGTLVNGIKEIFATSQSTATHLPVCASDGTPQGRISVGDLASVLGGLYVTGTTQNGDADDYKRCGTFIFSSDAENLPTHDTWLLTVVNYPGGRVLQTAWNGTSIQMWVRNFVAGAWQNWKEFSFDVPTFYKNYNDLSSLKTALGVNSKLRNLGSVSVAAGATEVMNIGAYCGFVFIVNQPSGHLSLIATSYGHSTEIAHESSDGSFTASVTNKNLSITNNTGITLSYSISLLV